jgi:hypothetical protein
MKATKAMSNEPAVRNLPRASLGLLGSVRLRTAKKMIQAVVDTREKRVTICDPIEGNATPVTKEADDVCGKSEVAA